MSAMGRKLPLAHRKFRNTTMPFVVWLPVALNRQRAGANLRRTAMSVLIFSPAIRRLTLGAAALTFVSPALAQTVVAQPVVVQPVVVQPVVVSPAPEQIVIGGHYGRLPDNVESASSVVGYGDLDLSIPADRD